MSFSIALRRLNHGIQRVLDEFGFLDQGYGGPSALRVSDRMARREHLNPTLRNIAEEIGDLDHRSTRSARAGMARIATDSLHRILFDSNAGGAEAVLEASGEGEEEFRKLIDYVLDALLEETLYSQDSARIREHAMSVFDVEPEVASINTFDGWIRRHDIAHPERWVSEFAKDAVELLDRYVEEYSEDDHDSDEIAQNVVLAKGIDRGVFTPDGLRNAVACHVMGEASRLVTISHDEFEGAWADVLLRIDDSTQDGDALPKVVRETTGGFLVAARKLAGYSTAYAALDAALGDYRCI